MDDFIANARRSLDSIVHPDDRDGVHRDVARALASGEPYVLEYRIVTASGEVRWILDRGLHAVDAFGRQCLDGIIFDVTRRRVAEEARLRSEAAPRAAELEASRARIIDAADEARRRLERDLHDGAQQRLVGAGVARPARRRAGAWPTAPGTAAMMLVRARTSRPGLEELRELARGIHPAVLTGPWGSHDALHALGRARVALPVRGGVPASPSASPCRSRPLLYYCAAEAITNVVKHGGRDAREGAPAAASRTRSRFEVADNGNGGVRRGRVGAQRAGPAGQRAGRSRSSAWRARGRSCARPFRRRARRSVGTVGAT